MNINSTMKDVAKAAGVSLGTVSKVINKSGYVSPQIRERVLLAISLLNYKPNGIARSLKNSKTNIIGVILPLLNDIYLMNILKTIEEITSLLNYKIIYCSTTGDLDKDVKTFQWLIEKRVDGILFYPLNDHLSEVEIPEAIPVVLMERQLAGYKFTTIMHENIEACRQLIQPLSENGHKEFIFIHASSNDSLEMSKINGFNKAVRYLGLEENDQLIIETTDLNNTSEYIEGLLLEETKKTCIVATNPNLLAASIKAANKVKHNYKRNISICGFGEVDPYGICQPSIRAAKEQPDKLVEVALDVLFEKINKKKTPEKDNLYIPYRIKN